MYQQIIIIGRLGQDPELRHLSDGKGVTNLSVATDRRWKGADGENKSETTWFKVSVWGVSGENASKYLHKGSLVMVTGHMHESKPFQNNAGDWKSSLEMTADTVKYLDPKPADEGF